MITEEYFLDQVSKLAHMKLITVTRVAAKDVYPKFSAFDTTDLDAAVDTLSYSEDRFDFTRLLKNMNIRRADRLEGQAREYHKGEARAAGRFFHPEAFSGECTRHKCRGCEHFQNCQTRGYEWLKGINTILSRKREPGEGKKMAEDFIKYMDDEFMKRDDLPF